MSYLEAPRRSKKSNYSRIQIILEEVDQSKVVSHGLSGCNKKTIKNKLVATRSGEFTICG
jgi:hypothetical protein